MAKFPLPAGWTERLVGEAGEVQLGRQRSPQVEFGNNMRPYLRVANVFDGYIDYTNVLEMNFTPSEQSVYGVRNGDLLLNEGQSLDLVGRCAKYEGPDDLYCFQNTLIRYRCYESLEPDFVYQVFSWWLRSGRFADIAKQTTSIAHLGADRFAGMTMAIPPLVEQRGIVESINSLDYSIWATNRAASKLGLVASGCFDRFLTRGSGGVVWPYRPLGELASISAGVTLGKDLAGPGTIELPYLRVANVKDGFVDMSDVKSIRILESEVDRYSILTGDVLMTEGGDFDKLGRGAVWDGRIEPCLHQNHIFRVRCDIASLLPHFLSIYSGSPHGRRWFSNVSKQSTNLASISMTQLQSFPVPCPPVRDQEAVVRSMRAIQLKQAKYQAELTKLKQVKQGLVDDLLTGRVRVRTNGELTA